MAKLRTMSTHRITFYRPGVRVFSNGNYHEGGTDTAILTEGSLQPFEQGNRFGEIVKLTPVGYDASSIKLYYTKTELRGANTYEGHKADYCALNDGVYEVMQTGDWNIPGFTTTSHYMFYLIRRPDMAPSR